MPSTERSSPLEELCSLIHPSYVDSPDHQKSKLCIEILLCVSLTSLNPRSLHLFLRTEKHPSKLLLGPSNFFFPVILGESENVWFVCHMKVPIYSFAIFTQSSWFSSFQITSHKDAWPFLEPVDVVTLHIPDYHKVMAKPANIILSFIAVVDS